MATLRQILPALRVWILLTLLLGLLYPLVLVGVGRLMPGRADGSLVEVDGRVVGSSLVGQPFDQPRYFWPRPSAGGYDMLATGGSNLGPNNPDLIDGIAQRHQALAAANSVPVDALPPDAVTASASGLDPHISPAYAAVQVGRVAAARGLTPETVQALVDEHTAGRMLGFLGEPTVNVLALNIALDEVTGG
jgi:K+-transporting ATPase ATPase C chain